MSTIAALQLFVLAALVLALSAGVVASLVTPVVMGRVAPWQPDRRFAALMLFSLVPFLLAVTSFVAVVDPSVQALVHPALDHCVSHGSGHAHICFVHLPEHVGGPLSWALLIAGLAWIGWRLVRGSQWLSRANRLSQRLLAMGTFQADSRAIVLPIDAPLCLTVGLFRPRVVLSQGLLARISSDRLDVILRHEEAHVRRYDTALRLLARMMTVFMLPSVRQHLLDELELAAEQSCDEAAAAAGDRLGVAETILQVEAMFAASSMAMRPLATSFAEHALDRRIASLIGNPTRGGRTVLVALGIACALTLLLAASTPLHHAIETLLGALTHSH